MPHQDNDNAPAHHRFEHHETFKLESGRELPGLHLAYTTLGRMNADGSNVVWVFHALTANSDPSEWWPGLVGEGTFFDPSRWFIICVNMPGSCYGSIGPLDIDPQSGKPWYHDFPFFTPRDMARAYMLLRDRLGIARIHVGIGGSMGGQQLLEWAIDEPEAFQTIIPIATNAAHSPWGQGLQCEPADGDRRRPHLVGPFAERRTQRDEGRTLHCPAQLS